MVSRALASLDAWLARAEEVLAEQREQALSPSLAAVWDPGQVEVVLPVGGFIGTLENLLEDVCRRPGRWILVAGDNLHRHRFWQALAFEDGSLVTEVVSNYYLEGEDRWTPGQEERLAALGWGAPDPPRRTNWIVVESTTSPPVAEVATRATVTLREVFGLGDGDEVFVKMFGSPIRGDTPASPEYGAQIEASPPSVGAVPRQCSALAPPCRIVEATVRRRDWMFGFLTLAPSSPGDP
jgi:hypothetical protein